MLHEYEFYQGVVLRQLTVEADTSLTFRPFVREGRINAFVMNGRIGVYIKHSSKRLTPWRFTFNIEQASDLLDLERGFPDTFIVFVCENDGLVTLDAASLHEIVSFQESDNAWVRVERPPNFQYEIGGNKAELNRKVARGISVIFDSYRDRIRERNAEARA